jgi:outer membrane protein assembly factor BamB
VAADAERVYTGSWDGHFFALNRKTGALRWAYNFGRPDSGAPVLYGGILFTVPYVEFLFALDAVNGRVRWKRPVPEGRLVNGTSSAHDGIIYTSDYIQQGRTPLGSRVLALDVRDGRLVWEHPVGGGLTAPVIARDKVCFGSTEHVYFTCVDAKGNGDGTTRMLWRTRMGGPVDESCPAIHGERAFVLAADRYLYAFE